MYYKIKTLQSEGYSQRVIAKTLEINRRTVAKWIKMDKEEACSYFLRRYQRPSGFDIAKEFIEAKLISEPNIKNRSLYQEVLLQYPEVTLTERTFSNYVEKIKSNQMLSQEPLKYSEPIITRKKENSQNVKPLIRDIAFDDKYVLNIGAKIKEYRIRLGLTKRELAQQTDVTPPMITYYEKGIKQPSLKTLIKIAVVTKVPVEYYITNNDYRISVISGNSKATKLFYNSSHDRSIKQPLKEGKDNSGNPINRDGIPKMEADKACDQPNQRLGHLDKEHLNFSDEKIIAEIKELTDEAYTLMSTNPDRCIELSKRALQIAQENHYNFGAGLAYAHIGSGYFNHAQYYKALKYYLIAAPIFQSENYIDGLRRIYNNIGALYYQWDELEKALEYYRKTLEMETEDFAPRTNSTIMSNIGTIYSRLKNYDKALQYYNEAYMLIEKYNLRGSILTLGKIGHVYLKLNQINKAEEYLNKAIEVGERIDDYLGLSKAYLILTELKNHIGQFDQALLSIKKALDYAQTLDNLDLTARIYLQFANLFHKMNKPDKQKDFLERCIAIAEPNNYRVTALSAYQMLAKLSEIRNDLQSSLFCMNKILQINDYINDEKRTRAIEEIKTKLEVERTEREKDILRQKNYELQIMNEQIVSQKEQLEQTEKELIELNHNLEVRVQEEVQKRHRQEKIISKKIRWGN